MLKSDSTTINTEHTQVLALKVVRDLFEGVSVEDLFVRKSFLLHRLLNRNRGSLLFFLEGGEVIEIGKVTEAVIFLGLLGLGLGDCGELRKWIHLRCFIFAGFLFLPQFLFVGVLFLEEVVEGPIIDSEFEGVDGVFGLGDSETVARN